VGFFEIWIVLLELESLLNLLHTDSIEVGLPLGDAIYLKLVELHEECFHINLADHIELYSHVI